MTLLSKNKIKYIRSLELKKIRKEEKVFLAEGILGIAYPVAFWLLLLPGYENTHLSRQMK